MVEKLLTAAEVARRLGISEEEVAHRVQQGRLRAIRLGEGILRFHPEDVAASEAAGVAAHPAVATTTLPPAPSEPKSLRHGVAESTTTAHGPVPWWERLWDFLYAYDFYFLALLLIGAIIAVIVTTQ